MSAVVEKALWLIEHRYGQELTLEAMAEHIGVSRFYLSRSFPAATGMSISAYLRGRRLTEAAKALAAGAPDILSVALEATYGSHEAFTRAFRDQFGLTPEQVRARGTTNELRLVEPLRMDEKMFVELEPPRLVDRRPLLLAGLMERHPGTKPEGVPAQWQRFNSFIGHIPNNTGMAAYGVLTNAFDGGDSFQYFAAIEVTGTAGLHDELTAVRLPAQRFAVFKHDGHVSRLRPTIHTIFNREIERYGIETGDIPSFIEYYGPDFDVQGGQGDVEIWVPVRA